MEGTHENQRMTLEDARNELDQQGLSCDLINEDLLVGISSKCHWELSAKLDLLVFVQRVPGLLTLDWLIADLQSLPSWIDQNEVGGKWPPFGFGRGRSVMLVYYAEAIAQEVVFEITRRAREREWCSVKFLAAQDAAGRSYYLSEAETPYWGRAFFPQLRYRAKKLTGCPVEDTEPPGIPLWIRIVTILSPLYIVYMCIVTPWLVLLLLGLLLLQFSIAAIVQYRKQKQPPVERENLLEDDIGELGAGEVSWNKNGPGRQVQMA